MVYIVYVIPIAISLVLILSDSIRKRRSIRLRKNNFIKIFDNNIFYKFDQLMQSNKLIYSFKNKYARKFNVITPFGKKTTNAMAVLFTITVIFTSIISMILFSFVFRMWYIFISLGILVGYSLVYVADVIIDSQMKKVQKQFPVALQIFTDYYLTYRNIKSTLTNTFDKMPPRISSVMEKLARELSSTYKIEEPILEFARSLDYVWGYAFAELLLISYEGVGDISDDLLFLNELVNEDIRDEEETKSELAGNKMLFFIINMVTLLAFIFNNFANPIARQLYFYTSFGNNIILIWVLSIFAGLIAAIILEKI